MSYSQDDEEKFIIEYFRDYVGNLLDIGAYHPTVFSNSRKLIELGWDATLVEPDPACYPALEKEYKDNPKIHLINKAIVTNDDKEVKWFSSKGDALSTMSPDHAKKWHNYVKGGFDAMTVPAMNVQDFNYGYWDFINVDAEGVSLEILQALNLGRTKMICVESDYKYDAIRDICFKWGLTEFLYLAPHSLNLIYAKPK